MWWPSLAAGAMVAQPWIPFDPEISASDRRILIDQALASNRPLYAWRDQRILTFDSTGRRISNRVFLIGAKRILAERLADPGPANPIMEAPWTATAGEPMGSPAYGPATTHFELGEFISWGYAGGRLAAFSQKGISLQAGLDGEVKQINLGSPTFFLASDGTFFRQETADGVNALLRIDSSGRSRWATRMPPDPPSLTGPLSYRHEVLDVWGSRKLMRTEERWSIDGPEGRLRLTLPAGVNRFSGRFLNESTALIEGAAALPDSGLAPIYSYQALFIDVKTGRCTLIKPPAGLNHLRRLRVIPGTDYLLGLGSTMPKFSPSQSNLIDIPTRFRLDGLALIHRDGSAKLIPTGLKLKPDFFISMRMGLSNRHGQFVGAIFSNPSNFTGELPIAGTPAGWGLLPTDGAPKGRPVMTLDNGDIIWEASGVLTRTSFDWKNFAPLRSHDLPQEEANAPTT